MAETWLVTGSTGQVGLALTRAAPAGVTIVAPPRAAFDLADLPALGPWMDGVDAVINCGAYTAVDKAESEPDLARAINADGPARLAAAAARAGIPIIHVSTDYVFAPDRAGPWQEGAEIAPASVYGLTKAAGEDAVRASGAHHAIVRTAWVVSADGHNFIKTMLRLGAEQDQLGVVADQRGTPTHAGDLAGVLATIARRMTNESALVSGTWHCANAGETTWHGLANHVFGAAARFGFKVPQTVAAIATADYPTPARRPLDSRLDCGKLARDFGVALRPWQEAVDQIVADLAVQRKDAA
jgi:dTDP-4-dehydrorhamnose reductase